MCVAARESDRAAESVAYGHRRDSAGGLDASEEPVRSAAGAGGEVERVRRPGRAAVAERQAPQLLDLDHLAVRVLQRTAELPVAIRLLMVGVDRSVAEVADQQIATEGPEVGRGERQSPGGVESTLGGD